ncbi:TetR family transcriptional regulator, partial [Streptomyces varsoviensis]
TGVSDEEWWAGRSALLREVAPDFAERFPMSIRLAAEATPMREGEGDADSAASWEREVDDTFAVGLGVLLDGIAAAR